MASYMQPKLSHVSSLATSATLNPLAVPYVPSGELTGIKTSAQSAVDVLVSVLVSVLVQRTDKSSHSYKFTACFASEHCL